MTNHKIKLQSFSDRKEIITLRSKILDETYDLSDFAPLFGLIKRNIEKVNSVAMTRLCELMIYLLMNEQKEKNALELLEFIDGIFAYK